MAIAARNVTVEGNAKRQSPRAKRALIATAAMVVIVNFVVDVLYAFIDPRIKVHDL